MKNQSQSKESRKQYAQDKESDSKSKPKTQSKVQKSPSVHAQNSKVSKLPQNGFDPVRAKGKLPETSRSGSHVLQKTRNKKQPVNITLPPVKTNQPKTLTSISPSKPTLSLKSKPSKTTKRGNSVVSNMEIPARREQTADLIQSRLKKKSPWFQSLMSPVDNAGVKIPDPIGTETAVYQHLENVTVPVGVNGMSGLRILSPYINSSTAIGALDGVNYQVTASESKPDETGILWTGTAGSPDSAVSFRLTPQLMKANARSHRIVSACVIAQTEISTLSDSGEGCAFVTPFGANFPTGSPSASLLYSTYQFQYDSTIAPVNIHKPLVARWYPLQSEANPVTAGNAFDEYENVSYQDFVNPNDNQFAGTDGGVIPWEFGIIYTGLDTSKPGVCRFQICINYEFIPQAMSAMVVTAPSPVDEVEENLVNSWVSDAHVTEIIPPRAASVSQSASRVSEDHEPSGLGMLFNVIQEVIPLAAKTLPLLL